MYEAMYEGAHICDLLAVIKAITLLDKLTDRSDKDKNEDMEATIHVSESVCNALRESPYPGPVRTSPQSWRVNYRKKCLKLFMQAAGLHDEMSVRSLWGWEWEWGWVGMCVCVCVCVYCV